MFTLRAAKRIAGKNKAVREQGEIPAVFYGAGKSSTPISVNKIEFKKLWRKAGESTAISISVEGEDVNTLIHEVQTDPVRGEPIHVDFLAIDMKKAVQVNVPLEFEGESGAVKSNVGTLVKVLHEVEIEALPADLPHSLSADVGKLESVGDQILVKDIKLPKGVKIITGEEEVVALIAEQKEEKEEEAPVDLSAIEVEKKGKKEEVGEGAEPTEAKTEE